MLNYSKDHIDLVARRKSKDSSSLFRSVGDRTPIVRPLQLTFIR